MLAGGLIGRPFAEVALHVAGDDLCFASKRNLLRRPQRRDFLCFAAFDIELHERPFDPEPESQSLADWDRIEALPVDEQPVRAALVPHPPLAVFIEDLHVVAAELDLDTDLAIVAASDVKRLFERKRAQFLR